MLSYKKILLFFKQLNLHRNFRLSKKAFLFLFSVRNNKITVNLNKVLISVFTVIKVINSITMNDGFILVVGNSFTSFYSQLFCSSFIKTNFLFIQHWVHGLLSNWNSFMQSSRVVSPGSSRNLLFRSAKLKFCRFFYQALTYKLPSLVIVFQTNKIHGILQECFSQRVPVITVSTSLHSLSTYSVYIGSNTFFTNLVFFHLICSQVMFLPSNVNEKD